VTFDCRIISLSDIEFNLLATLVPGQANAIDQGPGKSIPGRDQKAVCLSAVCGDLSRAVYRSAAQFGALFEWGCT
jgi:hypothetical protein